MKEKVKLTKEEIIARVKTLVIDKLGVGEPEVTLEANFMNDLGADSLDLAELFMEMDQVFEDIDATVIHPYSEYPYIEGDEKKHIKSVGDLVNYIVLFQDGKIKKEYEDKTL